MIGGLLMGKPCCRLCKLCLQGWTTTFQLSEVVSALYRCFLRIFTLKVVTVVAGTDDGVVYDGTL